MKENPSPIQTFKRKNARHLECMLGPSHRLHKISLPKEFATIFGLG
jgi:hypothetical protein